MDAPPDPPEIVPGRNTRTQTQRERDRNEAAKLVLQGVPQTEIARMFNVTPAQISYDLKAIRKRWLDQTTLDLDQAKAQECAKIDNLERTYWSAYDLLAESGDGPSAFETSAILSGVLNCINRRCRLLGLDEPVKVDQRTISFTIEFDRPGLERPLPHSNGHSGGTSTNLIIEGARNNNGHETQEDPTHDPNV